MTLYEIVKGKNRIAKTLYKIEKGKNKKVMTLYEIKGRTENP